MPPFPVSIVSGHRTWPTLDDMPSTLWATPRRRQLDHFCRHVCLASGTDDLESSDESRSRRQRHAEDHQHGQNPQKLARNVVCRRPRDETVDNRKIQQGATAAAATTGSAICVRRLIVWRICCCEIRLFIGSPARRSIVVDCATVHDGVRPLPEVGPACRTATARRLPRVMFRPEKGRQSRSRKSRDRERLRGNFFAVCRRSSRSPRTPRVGPAFLQCPLP